MMRQLKPFGSTLEWDLAKALAREKLASSGIPFEEAETLGVELLMPHETHAAGCWTYDAVPSLRFNYYDPITGEPMTSNGKPFSRLRYLRKPKPMKAADGKSAEPAKYLQAKDTGCHAYFPRLGDIDWKEVRADPRRLRIITEGELKAIKGCMEGLATIGLGGVNSYLSGGELLPELAEFAGEGVPFCIVFDRDTSDKAAERVVRARQDLANRLIDLGCNVYKIDLPISGGKCGLDDFLVERRTEDLEELLANMEPMTKVSVSTTEDSLALQFRDQHLEELRFDHTVGKWFMWSGVAWRQDDTGKAFNLARGLCREASEKLRLVGNDKKRLESLNTARAVETLARTDPGLAVTNSIWDANPWLLGTPTGTVDLQTGELSPANPDDHISRLTAVAPAEKAHCPLWLRFLNEATGGDKVLIRFLQQWAGYSLTGVTTEQALLFIHGDGGNGKGVFVHVVSGIIGEYGKTAAMDTFTASYGTKHPTDMAMLRGARLVTASETEEGQRWDEQRIKQLTGGDEITAHFMRQDNFTFTPHLKLTIIGNHKPELKNVDDAIRRRFNIVPFVLKPEKPDHQLEAKLRAEWPGILRWMIEGCVDWQRNGLVRPKVVRDATEAYFEEQDTFAVWLGDECILEKDAKARSGELLEKYNEWAFRNKARKLNHQQFHDRVRKHPALEREKGRANVTSIKGVRLKNPPPKY